MLTHDQSCSDLGKKKEGKQIKQFGRPVLLDDEHMKRFCYDALMLENGDGTMTRDQMLNALIQEIANYRRDNGVTGKNIMPNIETVAKLLTKIVTTKNCSNITLRD